jgi:hypothetical protein
MGRILKCSVSYDYDVLDQASVADLGDTAYAPDTTVRSEAARKLANRVNRLWHERRQLPGSFADVAASLPASWVRELQRTSVLDGVDEPMLIAWLVVELAGDSGSSPFDRAALREARRLARKVPEEIAGLLRLMLAT